MLKTINYIIESTHISSQQAWWLLEFVMNQNRTQLQSQKQTLTPEQQQQLNIHIEEIAIQYKPLAYILGWVPFLDLKILTAPPTLIPRPETESWVYNLITSLQKLNSKQLTILDIGTGSGCIALSLAQALPYAHIYATDIAQSALDLAKKNAEINNITNITFLQSDLFTNLPVDLKFDLIVSNPPYINPTAQLDVSVLNWEDHGALFAPNQGMQIIKQIITQTHQFLKKNAVIDYQLIMEIDVSQGDIIKSLMKVSNFKTIEIRKDQFDRDRTVWAK